MFEKITADLKTGWLHRVAMVGTIASQVAKTFEQEYGQDHDAKNAAIETMIGLLQSYKDTPPTPPTATA